MEKKKQEKYFYKEGSDLSDFDELMTLDYRSFNLNALAEKIKLQSYRPKPKMLYY